MSPAQTTANPAVSRKRVLASRLPVLALLFGVGAWPVAHSQGAAGARTAAQAPAQGGPPSTDIYLVPLIAGGALPKAGTPLNVTNRDGYDDRGNITTHVDRDGDGIDDRRER